MNQLIRLAGVSHENRQYIISNLSIHDAINLKRDYYNKFDKNAIGVFNNSGESIGWIPRKIASSLAPRIDDGIEYNASINEVMGGNGLLYGVQISIRQQVNEVEQESRMEIQEQILSLINNQTEESEKALINYNESVQVNTEKRIIEGDIEQLSVSIRGRWLSLENIKSFVEYCFNVGRFEDSFNSLQSLYELSDRYGDAVIRSFCNENLDVFIKHGYHQDLPKVVEGIHVQSVERDDETYPELDRVNNSLENNTFQELLLTLEQDLESFESEIKAAATFEIGELCLKLNNQQYEAVSLYRDAIEINPNIALYWGYAAQIMNRMDEHPLASYRFISRAILLDPKNPKWRLVNSLLLLKMGIIEQNNQLIEQYRTEINLALKLCRPSQERLRFAIKKLQNEVGMKI